MKELIRALGPVRAAHPAGPGAAEGAAWGCWQGRRFAWR